METSNRKWITEARATFPNPYTVCSWCICRFVDEELNEIYPFANGLNGLNGLAHLQYVKVFNKMVEIRLSI
jgi:hypothetical protein